MNWFQKILQELGLASYDDESGVSVPVVTVKIVDNFNLGLNQGDTLTVSQLAAKVGASDTDTVVKNIASAYSGATFARMLEPMTPAEVDTFVHEAQANDPTYEPPNFNNFLEIVCSAGFDTDPIVTALQAWTGVVEFAGRNPEVRATNIVGTDYKYFANEVYLSATKGVNAQAAWDKGADGTGTHIVDVEAGWFLKHVDLPTGIQLLHGLINPAVLDHGTAVLGILVAQNKKGTIGLAPKARADVSSANDSKGKVDIVKAILAADKALSAGDVIVFPIGVQIKQTSLGVTSNPYLPLEAYSPYRLTIRAVVARGRVVVEGAGNDAVNLDNCVDSDGKHIFDKNNTTEFKDSGAIIVAAGTADQHPSRRTTSQGGTNYGHRIDCCAHGEKVVTCDYDSSHTDRTNLYTGIGGRPDFSGTSAAAPIVAGCCLLIQHLQALLKPNDGKLNPTQMRDLLRDPNNCNASHDPTDLIGGMPVFDKILHNVFQQP